MSNLSKEQRELNENLIYDEYYNEFSYIENEIYYSVSMGGKTLYITPCEKSEVAESTVELKHPVLSIKQFKKQLESRGIIL